MRIQFISGPGSGNCLPLAFGGGIFHNRREVCRDHYRKRQAAEVLSKLLTLNDKLSFVKVPLSDH
jgi:hypothetical protein